MDKGFIVFCIVLLVVLYIGLGIAFYNGPTVSVLHQIHSLR